MAENSAEVTISPENTADSSRSKNLTALTLVLIIAFCFRITPVLQPLDAIDNQSLVDDTYLSLEIAKNIGTGRGPLYKQDYTSGYQPLYVLLAAPLFIGFDESQATVEALDTKVRQALGILILFDLGSLIILGMLLANQFGWRTPTFIAITLWAIHPMIIKTSLNGMETSIATFFLLLVIYIFQQYARRSLNFSTRFLFGILLGLAVLARIDLAILGFWILVIELYDIHKRRWTFLQGSTALITTFVGFLLSYLPWLLWSYHYTSDLIPISGSGVRYQSLILMNGHIEGQSLLWTLGSVLATILYPFYKSPILFLAAAIILIYAFRKRHDNTHWLAGFYHYVKPWLLVIAFCGTLIFAYGLYIMGWWFYDRYLFCLIFIPIVTLTAASHLYLMRSTNPNASRNLLLAVIVLCLLQPRLWTLQLGMTSDEHRGYRAVGLWLNETLPKGSTVGSMQTGGIGFYGTQLNVINLDGVVNKAALTALKSGTIDDYIKAEDIDYIVGWPVNTTALVRTSRLGETLKDRLTFIEESDFYTWSFSKWSLFKVDF